jgi:ribosomal protein S18 acetylase RimI-like enzyme
VINYTRCTSVSDLKGILSLQKANLSHALTQDEVLSQGFVTVNHTFELLDRLNKIENHIVAREHDKIVGYILAMTKKSRFDIPVLIPMFDLFDRIKYKDHYISEFNYLVIGQVCIDKNYRGQGILDNCYQYYKENFQDRYEFAITEIAGKNLRSMAAHKRIGFKEIHSYISPDNIEWIVVVWDWKNGN